VLFSTTPPQNGIAQFESAKDLIKRQQASTITRLVEIIKLAPAPQTIQRAKFRSQRFQTIIKIFIGRKRETRFKRQQEDFFNGFGTNKAMVEEREVDLFMK
jgi:hypothetical protein